MVTCPTCASSQTVKNGHIHNGKQRFKCQDCGRQFVEHPTKKVIDSATRELIDRLLLERLSLAGIARAAQVSEQWLQTYVNEKYARVPRNVKVASKKRTSDDSMRWAMVFRRQQRQQTVGLVSARCRHSWDCGRLYRHTGWGSSTQVVGIVACALSPMCHRLHWLLGSLWSCSPQQAASTCRQRNWKNELYWAIQQHLKATGISVSAQNLILLKISRESHWCYLVFHPSLQCIITCVALPMFIFIFKK